MVKELAIASALMLSYGSVSTYASSSDSENTWSTTCADVDIWDYTTQIEDGAIYCIRLARYESKVLDIPNSQYAENVSPILYNVSGYLNQRFIVKKDVIINGVQTYTISPAGNTNFCLTLEPDIAQTTGNIILTDAEYYETFNFTHRLFTFENGATTNSLRIKTAHSGFSKYVVPTNFSTINGTSLIQTTYNASDATAYDWFFEKTDSVNVNTETKVRVNGTAATTLNFKPHRSGTYILKTLGFNQNTIIDTNLEIYQGNTLLEEDDDGGPYPNYSYIVRYFNENIEYKLKIRGCNSTVGDVVLEIIPFYPIYMTAYSTNNTNFHGCTSKLGTYFEEQDYYFMDTPNMTYADLSTPMLHDIKCFQQPYFMIAGPGNQNGTTLLYDGTVLTPNNIPGRTCSWFDLVIWASQYSAVGDETFSLAVNAALTGANYSVGWPAILYPHTLYSYTNSFWHNFLTGEEIQTCLNNAKSDTIAEHPENIVGGWGLDSVLNGCVYHNGSATPLSLADANVSEEEFPTYTMDDIDILTASENVIVDVNKIDSLIETTEEDFVNFINSIDYQVKQLDSNTDFYVQTIDDTITNVYYAFDHVNLKYYKSVHNIDLSQVPSASSLFEYSAQELVNNSSATINNETNLFVYIDNQQIKVKRIEFTIIENELTQNHSKYYNVITGEEIAPEIINKAY